MLVECKLTGEVRSTGVVFDFGLGAGGDEVVVGADIAEGAVEDCRHLGGVSMTQKAEERRESEPGRRHLVVV